MTGGNSRMRAGLVSRPLPARLVSLFGNDRGEGPLKLRNYIGGAWVPSETDRFAEVVDPATGEVLALAPNSTEADADRAVEAATKAFWNWRSTPLPERVELMFALRQKLLDHGDQLAEIITREHGKALTEARDELTRGIQYVEDACCVTQTMRGSYTGDIAHGVDEYTVREPLGVFLILPPFNFPAMISLYFVWAIACGNTTVIKPASPTPLTTHYIVNLAEECGFPPGVINVLNGSGGSIGDYLVGHPGIAGVSFVGSSKVGLHIYDTACAKGKRAQVQGGAKNHVLICEDAVMGPTVKNVISSCFGHVGERCFAVSNVLVVESLYDEFKERFIETAKALKVGAGMEPDTAIGPVVSKKALQKLHDQIESGLAEGATMLLDGRNPQVEGYPDGCFLAPTILEAQPGMEIFEEEAFGPVRCFMKVKDIGQAIEIINQNRYGHTACIYTETAKYARSFMERCNVGQVGVNIGTPAPIAFYAVGGRKLSFFGSTRGRAQDAVDFYTDKKVMVSRWLRKLDFESETDKRFPEWSPAAGLW